MLKNNSKELLKILVTLKTTQKELSEEKNLLMKMFLKLEMHLNQLNKLTMMQKPLYNLLQKHQLLLKLKDKNALLTQLKLDMHLNKPKTIQELPNGIFKKLQLLFINLKLEKKPLTDHLLSPQLKVPETQMVQPQHSNHLVDGKKIPHTLETLLSKLLKISDHAITVNIQDSPVQLKSYLLKLVWLLFQQVNKLLSVTALQV